MNNTELDLNALGLVEEGVEELDLDSLPQERSSLPREVPQPGTLVLRVPGNLQATDFKDQVDTDGVKRLRLAFADDLALVQAASGAGLNYNITDFRRSFKDKDGNQVTTSEFLSFMKALGIKNVSSKKDMILGILAARGQDFKADLGYTATCNPKRNAWIGGKESAQTGCGQKYDMKVQNYKKKDGTEVSIKQIPREASGKWLNRFQCSTPGCGADLQAFIRLSNYRAVGK